MVVKQKKPRSIRGSEMRKLGEYEYLQVRLRAQTRLSTKLGRELCKIQK